MPSLLTPRLRDARITAVALSSTLTVGSVLQMRDTRTFCFGGTLATWYTRCLGRFQRESLVCVNTSGRRPNETRGREGDSDRNAPVNTSHPGGIMRRVAVGLILAAALTSSALALPTGYSFQTLDDPN